VDGYFDQGWLASKSDCSLRGGKSAPALLTEKTLTLSLGKLPKIMWVRRMPATGHLDNTTAKVLGRSRAAMLTRKKRQAMFSFCRVVFRTCVIAVCHASKSKVPRTALSLGKSQPRQG